MQALIITAGQDIGGQNIRWKRAADRHMAGRLRIRAVTSTITYAQYPTDIVSRGNGGAIRRLWQAADVVHLNQYPRAYERHGAQYPKPVLLHHHGTVFRSDPKPLMQIAAAHHWPQAVSTLDLTEPDPETLHWLPTAYDLDGLAAIRTAQRRPADGVVRVASAPTNPPMKGTAYLVDAVERLQAEGLPVELDLIEGVTNAECIRRKASADIYFDQLPIFDEVHGCQHPGGYGCNAIEAWGLGLPVISGATPYTQERMRREFNGQLPFVHATSKSLVTVLRRLVQSADLRAEWAAKGMEHAQRYHAEASAVERLMDLYQRAIDMRLGSIAA